jgi:hypothetical protein
MQFHLDEVMRVKNGPGHALYEEIRSIKAKALREKRPRTIAEQNQIHAAREKSRQLYDEAAGRAGAVGDGRTSSRVTAQQASAPQAVSRVAAKSGETVHTRGGKSIHKRLADERRSSEKWDLVNEVISDADGRPIQVPKRVDLETGAPVRGRGTQGVQPDAVNFERRVVLDDKPLTRSISRDRQQIIRFIEAYKARTGEMPRYVAITRYDHNGVAVRTDLYTPDDFLVPRGR